MSDTDPGFVQDTPEDTGAPVDYKAMFEAEKQRADEMQRRANGQNQKVQELVQQKQTLLGAKPVAPAPQSGGNELTERLQALESHLYQKELETYKAKVLEQYPTVKPLGDMLYGESPEELEAAAKTLSERLASIAPNTEPPDGAQVSGGGQAPPEPTTQEELAQGELQKRNWLGYIGVKRNLGS